MKMIARIVLTASLLAGCSHDPGLHVPVYETIYDCSLSETRGALLLRASPDSVAWTEKVDGVQIGGSLSYLAEAEKDQFQRTGFHAMHYDQPIVFFDYPDDLKPDLRASATIHGRPLASVFGGARVGQSFVAEPVSINVFLSLNWAQIETLLRNEGDIEISLYDAAGRTFKTVHLARTYFAEIEASLQSMHARVMAREADPEHLCEAETYEVGDEREIIVT